MGIDEDTRSYQRSRVATNGIELSTWAIGDGPSVILLHGWPHTWELWRPFGEELARSGFRAVAPDLRGIGDSERPQDGYDVATTAADIAGLIDALAIPDATVIGIDAGVAPAFFLALSAPERVRRLVVMEGLLPGVPGAEDFLTAGPPWWFGFHAMPGLAETVLVGHEAEYLHWFLTGPSVRHDIGASARSAFTTAYTGSGALRAGFEYYRAASTNAGLVTRALENKSLTVPTLAVSGGVVGDALAHQIETVADVFTTASIDDCGHIIPLEQPGKLAAIVAPFLE